MDTTTMPISLRVEDFRNKLTEVVNTSGVPLILVESVIADLHRKVSMLQQQQLEEDRKQWAAQMNQNGDDK